MRQEKGHDMMRDEEMRYDKTRKDDRREAMRREEKTRDRRSVREPCTSSKINS